MEKITATYRYEKEIVQVDAVVPEGAPPQKTAAVRLSFIIDFEIDESDHPDAKRSSGFQRIVSLEEFAGLSDEWKPWIFRQARTYLCVQGALATAALRTFEDGHTEDCIPLDRSSWFVLLNEAEGDLVGRMMLREAENP